MTDLSRTRTARRDGLPLRVVVFGSSTTEGYGASEPARTGYPPVMVQALAPHFPGGIALRNLGVSGECVEDMAPRVPDVVAAKPDLVIWQSGSNDAPRLVPLAEFRTLMQAGIEAILAAGADLALMEPQWSSALLAIPASLEFLDEMRALARRNGLAIHPRFTLMQDWARETGLGIDGLSPDGTHMQDAGYELLGRSVAAFVLARSGGSPGGVEGLGQGPTEG